MDFNYDLSKNIGKEIKVKREESKPEESVTGESKPEEPSQNLRMPKPKRVTADSTAINAVISRALAEGNKPSVVEKEPLQRQTAGENVNNIFAAPSSIDIEGPEETANNIFSGVTSETVIEKDPRVITSGGVGLVDDNFDDLVAQWNAEADTMEYEDKMNLIGRIIVAAQRDGDELAVGTWTCYRFILRNNYLKDKYNNYLQQLAGNEGYGNYQNYVDLVQSNPDLGWYEDLGWNEQPWEISAYFNSDDQEDWDVFHDEQHFGGQYIQLVPDMPAYEYIPAPPEQAYVYCIAMIARYSTKILAIQVKLHDPDIINFNNDPNNVLVEKLNKDIAYYRQLLNGMIAERNRLANELGYGYYDESGNGAFHFNNNMPNGDPLYGGLPVPGLTPPENNPPHLTVQEQFEALETEYFNEYGNPPQGQGDERQIEKVNYLITFANRMIEKGNDLEYWQQKLHQWQNELARLQNGG